MNTLDKKYTDLLQDILDNGTKKMDRTGTGTISVFGREIRHKMSEGFPLLTTKKMYFKGIVVELLWFLRGDTNIKYLVDNDSHIWDGDCYKKFQYEYINGDAELLTKSEFIDRIKVDDVFAKKWGELGPIYGAQWRHWTKPNHIFGMLSNDVITEDGYITKDEYNANKDQYEIDQIANLIDDLKTNPDSRRLMVTAWNPSDLPNQTLPPCHYGFQCYTRELSKDERMDYWFKKNKPNRDVCDSVDESELSEQHKYFDSAGVPKRAISLKWNQRSVDAPLGGPANILSYSLLLMMIAKQVNMIPEEVIGNLGDCHIYLNQIEGVKEQIGREPYPLPTVRLSDRIVNDISEYTLDDIILENYICHPKIYFPLSN